MRDTEKKSLVDSVASRADELVELFAELRAVNEKKEAIQSEIRRETGKRISIWGNGTASVYGEFFSCEARAIGLSIEKTGCPAMPETAEEFNELKSHMNGEKKELEEFGEKWMELLLCK